MSDWIQFFLEPYESASTINIILEFMAALFGVISVFYARKENILVFPTGIISTVIYVYLLSQWSLYGDLIINIYYTLMSIYGWYQWHKVVGDQQEHIAISRTTTKDKIQASSMSLSAGAGALGVSIATLNQTFEELKSKEFKEF
jgi:nicotinamide mononucleotide transporter